MPVGTCWKADSLEQEEATSAACLASCHDLTSENLSEERCSLESSAVDESRLGGLQIACVLPHQSLGYARCRAGDAYTVDDWGCVLCAACNLRFHA